MGEDSLLFYAAGFQPTADSRNFRRQMELACDKKRALEVARAMFTCRFPDSELEGKSLKEMMGMEGSRIRALYQEKAQHYGVGWKGRHFTPNKFELSDTTNQILTSANAALYGILCSAIHAMGYSPHIGFIHTGSPLPFIYDLADLYKAELCIDLAFALNKEMAGQYNKHLLAKRFRERVIEMDLLALVARDISQLLGERRK
ncbi:type I-E CRISPR-associated endonuclease Cas1e [Atlantibacter hermannii]|uniref:type I-E CRISPR-associated endonuclease Cas1e n=1 Tax=Atlantibacter hermannii TaxID=565 RepID=UPI00332EC703